MKKVLLFVLLGIGVLALNTDKATTKLTEVFAAKPVFADADLRMQHRLALLDQLREKKYKPAPVQASEAPTLKVHTSGKGVSASSTNSKAQALSRVIHLAKVTSTTPQRKTVRINIPEKRNFKEQTAGEKLASIAPVVDKSVRFVDRPVKITKLTNAEIQAGNAISDVEITNVELTNDYDDEVYAHVDAINVARNQAPVVEYQWSKAGDRLIPVASNTNNAAFAESADNLAANEKFIEVKHGDTLSKIAIRLYGDANKYKELYAANRDFVKNIEYIYPGQKLRVPRSVHAGTSMLAQARAVKPAIDPVAHLMTITVEEGDTLSLIAERYLGDIKMYKKLYKINRAQLANPNVIVPGQKIRIPVTS